MKDDSRSIPQFTASTVPYWLKIQGETNTIHSTRGAMKKKYFKYPRLVTSSVFRGTCALCSVEKPAPFIIRSRFYSPLHSFSRKVQVRSRMQGTTQEEVFCSLDFFSRSLSDIQHVSRGQPACLYVPYPSKESVHNSETKVHTIRVRSR